jgi:hypothetical protein
MSTFKLQPPLFSYFIKLSHELQSENSPNVSYNCKLCIALGHKKKGKDLIIRIFQSTTSNLRMHLKTNHIKEYEELEKIEQSNFSNTQQNKRKKLNFDSPSSQLNISDMIISSKKFDKVKQDEQ